MHKGNKLLGAKGTIALVVLGIALVVLPLLLPPLPPPPMILMAVPVLILSLLLRLAFIRSPYPDVVNPPI